MTSEKEQNRDEARSRSGSALVWLTGLVQRLRLQGQPTLRDTLEVALKEGGTPGSPFTAEEREMLGRLLRFGASRVDDIMVPRADIIALEESEPIGALVHEFVEAGISRIPIYNETLDDPRGIIHIKDLFKWMSAQALEAWSPDSVESSENGASSRPAGQSIGKVSPAPIDLSSPISTLSKLRRPVLYVPPSMLAMNLLIRMQTSRNHMALVVDEYGGTDGLVTIEDLVEQIVGDIEDEHDEAEDDNVSEDPKLGVVAAGRTPVAEVEERFGQTLLTAEEQEDIDTLAGLVFSLVGRVPTRGEVIRHSSGLEFEILEADPRRVKRVRIHDARGASAKAVAAQAERSS